MIRGVVPQADEKGDTEEKGKTGIEKVRSPSHHNFHCSLNLTDPFPNRNDAITCQNVIPIHCEPVFSGQDIALYGSRSPHKMTLVLLPFCHFHIFIIIVVVTTICFILSARARVCVSCVVSCAVRTPNRSQTTFSSAALVSLSPSLSVHCLFRVWVSLLPSLFFAFVSGAPLFYLLVHHKQQNIPKRQ